MRPTAGFDRRHQSSAADRSSAYFHGITTRWAEGLVGSLLDSTGRLCTKPGLVLVPTGEGGNRFIELAGELVGSAPAATLLNGRISEAYDKISSDLANGSDAHSVAEVGEPHIYGHHLTGSPQVSQMVLTGREVRVTSSRQTTTSRR